MASKLKFAPEVYQPTWGFLEEAFGSEKAIRAEYTRLRDVAQKRLKRLANEGFSRSETYKENVGKFGKLSEFKTKGKVTKRAELASTMAKLARFVESPVSVVGGQRAAMKKNIERLHKTGYSRINESNYWDFIDFMNEVKERKYDKMYDSDRVVKLFQAASRQKIDPDKVFDDFERYLNNRRLLKELKPPKDKKKGRSSKDLEEALDV